MIGVETVSETEDDSAANNDVEAGDGKSNYDKRSAGDYYYLFL